jgi:dihydrofolate reductase
MLPLSCPSWRTIKGTSTGPCRTRRCIASSTRSIGRWVRTSTVGGPSLVAQAIAAGLVDEFHLIVAPIVVGGGKQWLADRWLPGDVRLRLTLLGERRFGNGMVHLHYRAGT